MERKSYRWCAVPQCNNTSKTNPNKLFIDVPRKADVRKKWLDLARRKCVGMSVTSPIYFCEDHFDLPNDMENYMRYHIMGFVSKVMLKPSCFPTKFQCQRERKRCLQPTLTSGPAAIKRQKLAVIQETLKVKEKETLQSNTEEVNTSLPTEIKVEYQTKSQDTGVVFSQIQYKSQNIATSPAKTWTSNVSLCPFKVEHAKPDEPSVSNIIRKLVISLSDSDTSQCSQYTLLFQQSSPLVQPLQLKSLPDSSSSNEVKPRIEKESELTRENMCINIKAEPHLYIGISKECYFLIYLIEKNTNIPIEQILLCLKKIRMNTTFLELGDQFGISSSYARKIFMKNIPIISDLLKPLLVKVDKNKIIKSLPIAFRHHYNKVNCIIDCFEIEIDKVPKALTWSKYNKGNTIKYLISSTPNGLVNYVSSGYGGQISDTLILENCGFLHQLEPESWVLAGHGFEHIKQLLIKKNCHLLRPPSVIQGTKLSRQEAYQTKQIANLRFHIKRVIQKIQEFSMLKPQSALNSKLISVLDKCMIIACTLINLQDSSVYNSF